MERNYAAFISYRHLKNDADIAAYLHRSIESYRIPSQLRKNGVHFGYVFRDEEELAAAGDLSEKIREALDHSEYLIVVCSKETPGSVWVGREISYFLKNHDHHHVIAVLTEGEPRESFPKELTEIADVDGTIRTIEPRAADFRDDNGTGTKPNRKTEMTRIYAAMLGCSFDDLMLRQQKRLRRNILLAAAAVLAVSGMFIGTLLYKNRQLEEQNELLASQKREISMKQSELLTTEAKKALADGDDLTAIRYALDALPANEEDDKVCSPEAEAVLLSAAQVFDISRDQYIYMDQKTVPTQGKTDAWALSRDGRYLIVLNRASEVTAYDPLSGEILWKQSDPVRFSSGNSGKVTVDEKHRLVLVQYYKSICAYRLDTGEEVWKKEVSFPAFSSYAFSDEGDLIAYVDFIVIPQTDFKARYDFVVLQIETGEETARITFDENVSAFKNHFREDSDGLAACLSGEGNTAVLSLEEDDAPVYLVFDLEEKRVLRKIDEGNDKLYYMMDLKTGEDLKSFYAVYLNSDIGKCAVIKKYSLDGELLNEFETEEEKDIQPNYETSFYFSTSCYGVLDAGNIYMLYGDNYLYIYDLESGSQIARHYWKDKITGIFPVQEGIYGVILADGSYYIAAITEEDQQSVTVFEDLGTFEKVMPGSGGCVKVIYRDDGSGYISLKDVREEYGVVAAENPDHSLDVLFIRRLDPGLTDRELLVPEEYDYFGSFENQGEHNLLVLGDGSGYYIFYGDRENMEKLGTYDFSTSASNYLFPDGSGFMAVDSNGNIYHYDIREKSYAQLTEEVVETFSKGESINYIGRTTRADAGYLEDGTVFTVWCDGKTIQWWLNDERQQDIPLPEDLQWGFRSTRALECMLDAFDDGKILLSSYAGDAMDRFCIYDTAGKTWRYIEDAGKGPYTRKIAYGSQRKILAVLEKDLYFRIYDADSGNMLKEWLAGISLEDVDQMEFIEDDRYLLIHYADDILQIFDTENFDVVFETEMNCIGKPIVQKDRDGHRLYVFSETDGICLETETWTKLAEFWGVRWFDRETGEIFYEYSDHYFYRNIPSLEELAENLRKGLE